jgi:hypothetical protein
VVAGRSPSIDEESLYLDVKLGGPPKCRSPARYRNWVKIEVPVRAPQSGTSPALGRHDTIPTPPDAPWREIAAFSTAPPSANSRVRRARRRKKSEAGSDWVAHRFGALIRERKNVYRSRTCERRSFACAYYSVSCEQQRSACNTTSSCWIGNVSMQYRFMMPEWCR